MNKINLIFLLIFWGCSSVYHVVIPIRPRHAPDDYEPIGVVKYLNDGSDSNKMYNRNSAFKKMYDACADDYKIIEEGERLGNSTTTYFSFSDSTSSEKYWYITYKCTESEEDEEDASRVTASEIEKTKEKPVEPKKEEGKPAGPVTSPLPPLLINPNNLK